MSKVFAGISKINGAAAPLLAMIPGVGPALSAMAMATSALYGTLAKLTADPPRPPSQLQELLLGANQPMSYALGRCEVIGQLVHREDHGKDREGVPNPWRTLTIVLSGGGPVTSIDELYANKNRVQFDPANGWETGYYDKYMRADTQLGAVPETSELSWIALDPGAPPTFDYWSPNHKLSGHAAMQFGMLLDTEETQYRSGGPLFSAVGRWTKHYDPRLDSTFPGGLGAQRLGDEATYQYSVNGVIQALTYAYGRYQNGKLVLGGGLPVTAIDVASFVTAANIADANGWTCNGVVFENGEDGEIWNNVQLMLQTASAWATNDAGVLRCLQRRPIVTVDTIVSDDLVGPWNVPGMTAYKDGFNTLIPSIVSEANEWVEVPIDAVGVQTLIDEQGEVRSRSQTYGLVTNADQAASLAALDIYDSVEIDPIQLVVGRRFIDYPIGVGFNTDLPDLGLIGQTVVVLSKDIDPLTGNVTLGLKTDTTAKHAYALGQTATAPPQPSLVTNAELDAAALEVVTGPLRSSAILSSSVSGLNGQAITVVEQPDGSWTANIPQHTRIYANPQIFPSVTVNATTRPGLQANQTYRLYYDDDRLAGGDVDVKATTSAALSVVNQTNPFRHKIGIVTTPAPGGTPEPGNPSSPPGTSGPDDGWGGDGDIP